MLSRSHSPTHPIGFIEPCLLTRAHAVPTGERWAFEIKADGYRFIARRDGDRVRVFSRSAKDWTDKVPAIIEALQALTVTSATLDGEGVVVTSAVSPISSGCGLRWPAAADPARSSSTASTCLSSTATICGASHGKFGARRSPAYCARRARASG